MKSFRRTLMVLVLASFTFVGWAQDDVSKKFSITTQMFLSEMRGDIKMESPSRVRKAPGQMTAKERQLERMHKYDRFIAEPDTIKGKVYISAFIRLDDNTDVSELEAMGVEVQCKFDNGLVTANIPVDKLEEIGGITNVKRISVARRMRPFTDKVREATNVDDVLTQSADAIAEGILNKYDGTGVLLGIIDTGIDFQHIAFKDKNGNSRIKRAYVYNGSNAREYGDGASYSFTSSAPTTDDNEEDHGTHTSSTAGGSSVIISGSSVTVTDDHASATYGGMAPGADLYLAGINGLDDTYIANAFQKICNYADQQGKPVVVSNSWGASMGPRDGTGEMADICNQYFSDDNPNHICLFAASNDAGTDGFHVSGTGSSSNPVYALARYNSDYYSYYYGIVADVWARSASVTSLGCKVSVVNSSGTVQTTVNVTPSTSGATVSLGSTYVSSGSLYAYKNYIDAGKQQIMFYANSLRMRSGYYLRLEVYPTNGSGVIDFWAGTYTYFSNGSDDMCVSDEATIPDAISIGAYVSKNKVTDYNGSSHSMTSEFPRIGDIAYFSSYATADQSPTGLAYPWICAPGATTVAAVNHYDTSGDYSYINGNSAYYGMYRVNSSTTNPYGSMEGTSMATPAAAGIVALWLQAAQEIGKDLTTSDVKEVMKETAINDSYTTTGANASHFGNGKIDALAGIKYILGATPSPRITAEPTELSFTGYVDDTYTQTVNVKGTNLADNITATISGDASYTIDKPVITKSDASTGVDITVTWNPTAAGNPSAVLTLASTDADDVTINISGNVLIPEIVSDVEGDIVDFTVEAGLTSTKTIGIVGADLKDAVTLTLDDPNEVFSLSATTVSKADAEEGKNISVTFAPVTVGSYTATVTISSPGAESVVVTLNGTAIAPVPTLITSESTLSLSTDLTNPVAKTFTVGGRALSNDVTITLADPNGVFTVSPTTIAVGDITADGVEVTVTFQSAVEGTFTGRLQISSEGVESVTVNLSAEASDGGTASDSYLNIAKYATIDEARWRTSLVRDLYKYTEYQDEDVAWLTMPLYGAFVGAKYSPSSSTFGSGNPQKWIETNVTSTQNTYAGVTWEASDVLLGSSSYFADVSGTGKARAMGYNSSSNKNEITVSFYVTNTTAVKMYGTGRSGTSNSYPGSIKIYECTRNADGSLTASSTATKQASSGSTSSYVISCDGLDSHKVYKVVAGAYRGYMYEIAFQTPLKTTLHGDVTRDGKVDIADVTATIDIVLGKDSVEPFVYDHDAADMDDDGDIDISDVTALIDFILGKQSE
ncbi:MAG: S8 family serine peptidase [Prevotella sp.]|nr:S8 family serine peptidase [Prevotella sp.]